MKVTQKNWLKAGRRPNSTELLVILGVSPLQPKELHVVCEPLPDERAFAETAQRAQAE